ncbi:glycosyltransferase [Brevibacillus sp. 179-C9.3 HS]|uniref:glycosyltransferase n=1 Tax=unclassified Brevibacillus TaxID=2684853 RepID=UPI0039A11AE9
MNNHEQPLVSIIIPIYNTEKFLVRAIDSVLSQSYSNIEVILVNDGSTDDSGRICDNYVQKYPNVKVIHQKNNGVSVSRNIGLEKAKGKYIQFVDSDDEINRNMTETLVFRMEEQGCDIVICGYTNIGLKTKSFSVESGLFDANEFIISSYLDSQKTPFVWSSCNMIYKNTVIKKNNLRFDTNYAMGEDGLFTLEYLLKSDKIYIVNDIFYKHYLYQPEERISAISHFILDLYELRMTYFELLFTGLREESKKPVKLMLLQTFYDQLIAGLVRLGAYSEYFSREDMIKRISSVLNSKMVIQASRVYRKKRSGDSIIIPLLMRLKCTNLLLLAIKQRGKKYIARYGKCTIVRSIYSKPALIK